MPPDPESYRTARITSRFTDIDRTDPQGKRRHNAVDFGNFTCGETLIAMADGQAFRIKHSTGALGVVVRCKDDPDYEYGYWHCSQWLVANNSAVRRGQPLASIGNTGISTGCHCHLEIKYRGVLIDPEPFMFGERNPISGFADVPDDYPHARNIARAVELGLLNGISETEFRPFDPASRGSLATLAVRLYDRRNEGS